ncbi:unnamed protein product [Blepharisma stoltei]|uniref:Uncharacterized protein n=1 Tax=Blepharisma stoltei TaxID=1481888 RepID=A0AAU9K2A9_9CILI|nr:unnamed protein product [Blepharisma stoltei]
MKLLNCCLFTSFKNIIINSNGRGEKNTWKSCIIGESKSGKTSFLNKVIGNRFSASYKRTIGSDFSCKEYQIGEKLLTLQFWDTPRREGFQRLGYAFCRGAQAYFIFFDITDRYSFEQVSDWKDEFESNVGDNVFGILVGNKIDINNERVVCYEEAKTFADHHKMIYIEISAKTGQGCEVLERIVANKIAQ